VASYHTDLPGFFEKWGYRFMSGPTWAYLRWMHNQAALNLCPSRTTKQELLSHRFRNVEVWSRGVDTALYHPKKRMPSWRYRLTGGQPDRLLLITVARLAPEKRVDWIRPILDAYPGVCLAVIGDGPAGPGLEKVFAGTQAVFTGFLKGE
jgi:glycosyltransferase involved in cell wall biosynthesis